MPDLGIVGGGQLGRMLLYAAWRWGLDCRVLGRSSTDPCAEICPGFRTLDWNDTEKLIHWGRDISCFILEIEHVDVAVLEAWERANKRVFPSSQTLRLIQDKHKQKEFLSGKGCSVADFEYLSSVEMLAPRHASGFLKSCREGYDGRGVFQLGSAFPFREDLPSFPCLWEKGVEIKQEISVLASQDMEGHVRFYPPVEMVFDPDSHMMDYAICPAPLSEEEKERAFSLAAQVLEAFDSAGLFAIEMFHTVEGEWYVNEVAPRVHNSGHHTIEGHPTSQFEQMIRLAMGYPLGETHHLFFSATLNWVGAAGSSGSSGPFEYSGLQEVLSTPQAYPHIYGKKELRPFRKMGHVTVLAKEPSELHEKLSFLRPRIRDGVRLIGSSLG
ncbi:MAG: ATP-grasp domain-containing protein [Cytophagales bacterium]|nr:ATP-grasp domain-containing protein [Cytophagales bacterium]